MTERQNRKVTPQHGALQFAGVKPVLRLRELPPWHGWHYPSLAARVKKWIETYVRVPTGYGAGDFLKLADFQYLLLRSFYSHRATFVSIPTGNGKTTLLAATALERVARGDDYVEVAVVATKLDQAGQLIDAAKRMVECSPELVELFAWYSGNGTLEYRPTGSILRAHPAKLSAVQGLNFSLAIVDEFGFASDEVVESLIARLGKRPDSTIVGIGTPGFTPNVMFRMRERHLAGTLPDSVIWREWSADEGAEVTDRAAWSKANPALRAGFLTEDALATQAVLIDEPSFRVYHLGQWVGASGGWLPEGAFESCAFSPVPLDGTEVVLAVEGTYRRTTAVVGVSMDGGAFFGWAAEAATDNELREHLDNALARFNVREVVVAPRIRPHLFTALENEGVPVYRWTPRDEASASDELFRAIVEGRISHDHHPILIDQMRNVVARRVSDGSIRLARPDHVAWVDAALAVRLAWWRVAELSTTPEVVAPSVY